MNDDDDEVSDEAACSGNGRVEDADYERKVGFGAPPNEHRWKKGMPSPNPRGRPRKKTTLKYILERIASRKIEIKDGAQARSVSVLEAVLLVVKGKAINGHALASTIMETLRGEAISDEPDNVPRAVLIVPERLTPEEWEIAAAAYRDRQTDAATDWTD